MNSSYQVSLEAVRQLCRLSHSKKRDVSRVRFENGQTYDAALPLKTVEAWLSLLPGKACEVEFPTVGRFAVRFRNGNSQASFDRHEPNDEATPALQLVAPTNGGEFSVKDGRLGAEKLALLKLMAKFTRNDDPTRPALACISVEGNDVVACDSRRLLRVTFPFGEGNPEQGVLYQANGNKAEDVEYSQYPKWRTIMPDSEKARCIVRALNLSELETLLRRASKVMVNDKHGNYPGDLFCDRRGKIAVETQTTDGDRCRVGTKSRQSQLVCRVNAKWLIEACRAMRNLGEATADIFHAGSGAPLWLRGKDADYLQMPISPR